MYDSSSASTSVPAGVDDRARMSFDRSLTLFTGGGTGWSADWVASDVA